MTVHDLILPTPDQAIEGVLTVYLETALLRSALEVPLTRKKDARLTEHRRSSCQRWRIEVDAGDARNININSVRREETQSTFTSCNSVWTRGGANSMIATLFLSPSYSN